MRFSLLLSLIALITSALSGVLAQYGAPVSVSSLSAATLADATGTSTASKGSASGATGSGSATAKPPKKGRPPTEVIGSACYVAAARFNFGCPVPIAAKVSAQVPKCLCKNLPYIETVVGCINDHSAHNKTLQKKAFKTMQTLCVQSNYDYLNISKSLPSRDVLADDKDFTSIHKSPFVVPQSVYNHEITLINQPTTDKKRDAFFAAAVLIYWGGVFLLRALTNFCFYVFPRILLKTNIHFFKHIRQKFLLPAAGSYHHSKPKAAGSFTFSIPLRSEALVILGYIILNYILCFSKNDYYNDNFYNPSEQTQFSKELGNRSGQLVVSQLMLSVLFGGRNNFLIWITGWPLSTFNVFHKWVSRVVFVNLVVHGIAMSISVAGPAYYTHWQSPYFVWGVAAVILISIMIVQSMHYFRAKSYEIFLVVHIVLAAVALGGAWLHVKHPSTGLPYVYTTVAIWGFDRLLRWVRIIWSGPTSKAQVTLHEGNVIEYKIDYSRRWKYYPGSYAFIHVLRPNCFWQSHPFTLTISPKQEEEGKLVLFTRVKKGFTQKTRDYLLTQPNHTARLPVLLEGPYGHHHPVQHYETVVLVAGGIGITGVYPYADELIRKTGKNQKIVFVWAIADERPLEWFADQLDHLASDSRVDVKIHIGNLESSSSSIVEIAESPNPQDKEKDVSETTRQASSLPSIIPRVCGRPNMHSIVNQTVSEAGNSIAFVCCGPHEMNDDVRKAITDKLVDSPVRIDYFEESFGW
ncbi:Fre2p [Sugiyamaella lignohabitans]|uniref:Fre2p n=1 Tax=Sugiyamaella lignohabitans TaxID=796027 RepID=A0A167FY66_9ASCO|nr:Fre2p [Sugiyamaella lignohabitans]ANB15854.1 Fre2p [Sugiyamaella lignohabitans]